MPILCLITLMFINGTYLFVSFNLESMVPDVSEEQTEEVAMVSEVTTAFSPEDVLDLDIFDFDIEDVAGVRGATSARGRRTKALVVA